MECKFIKAIAVIQASLSLIKNGEMKPEEINEKAMEDFSELEWMLRNRKAEIHIAEKINNLDNSPKKSKSLDIFDCSRRKIRCVQNKYHLLLEAGKEYTLVRIDPNHWYTMVHLAEFPGVTFDSAEFEEI